MRVIFLKIKKYLSSFFIRKRGKVKMEWFKYQLNQNELRQFIKSAREGKSRNVLVGKISRKTSKKIKDLTGDNITKIILNSSSVIHAEKKSSHHLKENDVLRRAEVINNPKEVTISPDKNRGNMVLIFKGDIGGTITFVEGIHQKHEELSLITAYREK